ncbi:MAG: hypothetical protein HY763_02345 [Planctomycetes bacterium]|nr:hypothetical protein [Planctomycetota bacterium]
MTTPGPRAAFTLLELMAVTALLVCAVGYVTLHGRGRTDCARLEACAEQLAALYRTSGLQAAQSGAPRLLTFDARGCTMEQPTQQEGAWRWGRPVRVDLPAGVRLTRYSLGHDDGPSGLELGPARVFVAPSGSMVPHEFRLELRNGTSANIGVRGPTGRIECTCTTDQE